MNTSIKWSVDEYHRMIESGILGDRRVELLSGDIIEMSPETPLHYTTAKKGTKYLESILANKADVRFNGPITLSTSEPEPDIAIVRLPESLYFDRHPIPDDIFWLIEVANTSLKTDRELKTQIYASEYIQEYWILDLSAKQILVFRNPQNGEYTAIQTFTEGVIYPLAFANTSISVERLLRI
ncbi:MAG: Uma2 family endonuclease [Cyanobacteria bacterium P01_F01_bin.150]